MGDQALLGPWIRRFLLEHLVAERNLARNTQAFDYPQFFTRWQRQIQYWLDETILSK